MLTWFSLIWSLFQFLVIIDYFLGKKHIKSTMPCYTFVKHARFCEPGIVTFSWRYNFFVGELLENNWGKLVGFLSFKDVDLIQSNPLKSALTKLCTFSVMGLSMCSSIFSESSPVRSNSGIINELSGFPNSVPTVRCSVTSSNWHGHTGHAYCICFVGKH